MKAHRRTRGFSLIEVLMAAGLTALTISVSVSVFLYAAYNWIHGEAHVIAESDSSLAIQAVDRQVREAISVVVDPNGNGLTYKLPIVNSNGLYSVPPTWDGITRRIALTGGSLVMSGSDGSSQVLARSIYGYDPMAAPALTPYVLFRSSSGTTVRSLTVMIVTGLVDGQGNQITSRSRENVYLRNVPPLTQ